MDERGALLPQDIRHWRAPMVGDWSARCCFRDLSLVTESDLADPTTRGDWYGVWASEAAALADLWAEHDEEPEERLAIEAAYPAYVASGFFGTLKTAQGAPQGGHA